MSAEDKLQHPGCVVEWYPTVSGNDGAESEVMSLYEQAGGRK